MMMTTVALFWTLYVFAPLPLWWLAHSLGERLATGSTEADATLCGRCGYDVRDLPTHICPECGSDLNVVGRSSITRRRRQWRRRIVPVAWVVLMLVIGGFMTLLGLFSFSPRRQVGHMVRPLVAFIGNTEPAWPFLIVNDTRWDLDESPRAFGSWYPQRLRIDRLSSTGRGPLLSTAVSAHADADQALTWDSAHDSWKYESPGHAAQSGTGFPPLTVLRLWATEVVARRPPGKPLTDRELDGLIVAGGDALASSSPRTHGPQWMIDRAAMVAAGAAPLVMAQYGGSFRNDIIPFWPPAAGVAGEWLLMIYLCWRSLRSNSTHVPFSVAPEGRAPAPAGGR